MKNFNLLVVEGNIERKMKVLDKMEYPHIQKV